MFGKVHVGLLYRVAHKKRPELSHGIMQKRNQNESTE